MLQTLTSYLQAYKPPAAIVAGNVPGFSAPPRPRFVARMLSCTVVMSRLPPALSSVSAVSVNDSAGSVLSTCTLYVTVAHLKLSNDLVNVAVGLMSLADTDAVAHVGPTGPLFESVPLAHALSVFDCPASSPDTVRVNVHVAVEVAGQALGFAPHASRCVLSQIDASVGLLAEVYVKSTVPLLSSSSVRDVRSTDVETRGLWTVTV